MNIEPVVIPHVRLDAEIPAAKPPAPDHLLPPPTAEQAQVADRVFAHDQEASAVAGLLGMWSATLLLHDLMAEHLARPDDLDELRRKQNRPQPDSDGPDI
jgi:hypothetical protein